MGQLQMYKNVVVGTTIDILRRSKDISIISKAYEVTKMDLPKAPSAGLYLAKVTTTMLLNKM
jgi:hypothetical protein